MDKKVMSGEEYRETQKTEVQAKKNNSLLYWGLGIGGGVLLLSIGFLMAFLIFNHSNNNNMGDGYGGNSGGPSLNGGPNMKMGAPGDGPVSCSGSCSMQSQGAVVSGKVTAVSDTSITIQPSSGDAKTFTIKSSTKMVAGPGSGVVDFKSSSVHVGDKIGISLASTDSTDADLVLLNYQETVNTGN